MKKIHEGLEIFEDYWSKFHNAPSDNLRDKYELELKREIKKLQRFREQIKGWMLDSNVKEQDPLVEARHQIEEVSQVLVRSESHRHHDQNFQHHFHCSK